MTFSSFSPSSPPAPSSVRGRALVLHGGGSAGNAWEIGVVAGLLAGGVDGTDADLVVGTSAGATAAAQLGAAAPADLLDGILNAPPSPHRIAPPAASTGGPPRQPWIDHLERTNRIIAASTDAEDMRRRIGAEAIEVAAASGDPDGTRWRAVVAARLPGVSWPGHRLLITAVDARTGEPVVFDRTSGVDLVDAVAASTSSGPAYRIGDGWYVDGGYRRNENADLAAGCARVLVLSPFSGRTRHPLAFGMQLAAQVDELRAAGSAVETVFPDAASLEAFGPNMMDVTRRPASASAGYAQGRSAAERLHQFWH